MAANFVQLAAIANSTEFLQRVGYSMSVGATTAYNEVGTTQNHSARAAFAIKVAQGNYNVQAAAFAVLTNATIAVEAVNGVSGNSIPDGDIQFAVNSLWNMLAGV
jgi:hypothetical protein